MRPPVKRWDTPIPPYYLKYTESKFRKMFYRILLLCLTITVMVGCTTENQQDTRFNINDVQTILPTVSPREVRAYAQLADEETLALGQQIYRTNCASCHGMNGEGQFPDAPMQPDDTGRIGAPPHNGDGHTWHHDDDLLYEIVRNGGNAPEERFYPMPAFGEQLTDDEIIAVMAYIKTMWTEEQRLIQAERTLLVRQQEE